MELFNCPKYVNIILYQLLSKEIKVESDATEEMGNEIREIIKKSEVSEIKEW